MKPFFYILAAYSAAVLFSAAWLKGFDLRNFVDLVKLVPVVATADGILWFIFVQWLWKWSLLQGWLVVFPNLNGTWKGCIQTDWKDENGDTPAPIPAILTIKQSFRRVSGVMRTGEMQSFSYAEGFRIDEDAQIRRFCYSYTSRPSSVLRERSTPHDGTILFDIVGKPVSKLTGEYWTQRKTTGSISLERLTDELLDEMPEDMPSHPMAS
ncbi:MAG: hypothetical protein AAFY36_18490 [Bacteroidota bacterium]